MTAPRAVEPSPPVRAYAESLGAFGQAWLDALPARVARVCAAWSLRRGEPLAGGSRSYVCRVTAPDGGPAVLKVALPEPALATQLRLLLAADGDGYVRVLAHDLDEGALLLEALGPSAEPSTKDGEGDVPRVLDATVRALRRAWRVPPDVLGPSPADAGHKAAGLLGLIRALGPTFADAASRAAVDRAETCALARLAARDPAREVAAHGDAHAGNLLRVERPRRGAPGGYVLVDPEGFRCEPEYDLGVAVRGWNGTLLATPDPAGALRGWCERLARAADADPEAVWQWAYLERVSTGLYLARHGLAALGAPFLATAALLRD